MRNSAVGVLVVLVPVILGGCTGHTARSGPVPHTEADAIACTQLDGVLADAKQPPTTALQDTPQGLQTQPQVLAAEGQQLVTLALKASTGHLLLEAIDLQSDTQAGNQGAVRKDLDKMMATCTSMRLGLASTPIGG